MTARLELLSPRVRRFDNNGHYVPLNRVNFESREMDQAIIIINDYDMNMPFVAREGLAEYNNNYDDYHEDMVCFHFADLLSGRNQGGGSYDTEYSYEDITQIKFIDGLASGDLVLFGQKRENGVKCMHAAIYIGGNKFLQKMGKMNVYVQTYQETLFIYDDVDCAFMLGDVKNIKLNWYETIVYYTMGILVHYLQMKLLWLRSWRLSKL